MNKSRKCRIIMNKKYKSYKVLTVFFKKNTNSKATTFKECNKPINLTLNYNPKNISLS